MTITLIPVNQQDDRPIYGGSGRPHITAVYYTADGRLLTIGRRWCDPAAIARVALERGAVGTINVKLGRHGKRGIVATHAWLASDASLSAAAVKAADDAARKARRARGDAVLRRGIADMEARGEDAAEFRSMLGTHWASAYADDAMGG